MRKVYNDRIIDGIIYFIVKNIKGLCIFLSVCISLSIGAGIGLLIALHSTGDFWVPIFSCCLLLGMFLIGIFAIADVEHDIIYSIKKNVTSKYKVYEEYL
jgi:Na+/glutamate symporter